MENFKNPHMESWLKYSYEMSDAMKNGDIDAANIAKQKADAEYEKYKEFADKMYTCNGFESCNEAIQQVMPRLIKENTTAVKEIISLIKEDSNLSAQFAFYDSLKKCNSNDIKSYINEALDLISSKINYKTIKESNKKMINFVRKYSIVPEQAYTNEEKQLFENCEYILTHPKRISNLNDYSNKMKMVENYVKTNIKPLNEEKINIYKLIEDYDKKYNSILNEEEKSFVQEIMDFKKNSNLSKKQNFFESLKNDCLKGVDKLLESCSENEKTELRSIKEEIKTRQFCEETLVQDVAKLLELRDVILDK